MGSDEAINFPASLWSENPGRFWTIIQPDCMCMLKHNINLRVFYDARQSEYVDFVPEAVKLQRKRIFYYISQRFPCGIIRSEPALLLKTVNTSH
jgi:hypothetical protein